MQRESEVERITTNELLFREVNERIAEGALNVRTEDADFVCECGDPICTERVEATLEQYERVREDATAFLLVPGHDDQRVEATVEHEDDHAVVKKRHPVAAALARRLNPRAFDET